MWKLGAWGCSLGVVASSLVACGAEPLTDEELGAVEQAAVLSLACDGAKPFPTLQGDTTITLPTIADATIGSVLPGAKMGALPSCVAKEEGLDNRKCLMRFDTSSIPQIALVRSAKLTFNAVDVNQEPYEINPLRRSWTEPSVTWNSAAANAPWAAPGAGSIISDFKWAQVCAFTGRTGSVSYDLPESGVAEIQEWINGTSPNAGLVLRPYTTQHSGALTLQSKENSGGLGPQLTIVYSLAEPHVGDVVAVKGTTIKSKEPSKNFSNVQSCVAKRENGVEECLLRWDLSSIPTNRKVAAVKLTALKPSSGNGTYRLYPVRSDWLKQQATWNKRTAAFDWVTPGAFSPVDVDVYDIGSLTVGALHDVASGARTLREVQNWISDPASNKGVLVAPARDLEKFMAASDIDSAKFRLLITYF